MGGRSLCAYWFLFLIVHRRIGHHAFPPPPSSFPWGYIICSCTLHGKGKDVDFVVDACGCTVHCFYWHFARDWDEIWAREE
ncbi:hypothetical protein HBI56_077570 [Parastagonospora nodorum]|uniref:Secreted protein n=1 Tax=Phaeosphaeria nodorum (strain SN15 / ATCC MYA-4574 / FGSC 10173) TaxID=321614 RepID=A0A7U2HW71_PHANO|nr:hypothetical protein HBH56_149620 [Parastagonospora nodorum]QRC94200.1 hypothetical protein JI435_405350 [Parastagonospora nodorum SN15]KAH3928616.1 hypothetical protein HBH54_135520 [Parastagonospora nodorum]KAH3946101.1 hypothetical protein HBH53_137070 [Parastagonospora nodorum]KAH3983655.1 hypothetical protein HBH52_062940 [Parastagonospora nodorum]